MSLKTKQNHEDQGINHVWDCSRGQSINKNVCNFNDIQYFDGESYKEDFKDWMLEDKQFEERLSIEDNILEFLEEAQEENME